MDLSAQPLARAVKHLAGLINRETVLVGLHRSAAGRLAFELACPLE
ncbi:MAG: hypothetical protein ACYC1R_11005 [Coriobacteriia bacterium]